jgi:uncharacterized membrane protein (GlpM family)
VLASYKRNATIAGAIFLAFAVGDVVLISTGHKDMWNNAVFGPVAGITWAISYLYALWAFLKAKGRSPAWLVMVLCLNVLGLIVLLMLKDLHQENSAGMTA